MSVVKISSYSTGWSFPLKKGFFKFFANNSLVYKITINNTYEYQTVIDLLRNEEPIYFDTYYKSIRTSKEPVGEEENSDKKQE